MSVEDVDGISFVVPCFNSGHYVAEAVDSLLRQPMESRSEVLVVDDGSDDHETLRALAACGDQPGVRVIRCDERRGHHAARNRGIENAEFSYVMQLDSDDRLATDPALLQNGSYPQQAMRALRDDPDIAFVHTFSCMFGEFEGYTISSYPCREELLLNKHHVPTSIVCRRADAVAGGLYDVGVRKWGDWAFAVNLAGGRFRRGLQNLIECVPGPFHEYRIHSRTERVSATDVSEYEMTLRVVEDNLDFFRACLGTEAESDALARSVLDHKPSRLVDLMYMASFDLGQARKVAGQRRFSLHNPFETLGIP